MSLGSMIRQLRKKNNLTQAELGKKINVAKSTISQYENNINIPDIKMLQSIAKIFCVSVDYLLDEPNGKKPSDKIKSALAGDPELAGAWDKLSKREDLQLLFKQTKDMSPRGVKQVIRIIKAIEEEERERLSEE